MKRLSYVSLKSVISTSLAVALLGATVGCTVTGPGFENQPVYRGADNYGNANFNRVSQQLRNNLRRQGYQVIDIKPATYRSDRTITAIAIKNNQAYELRYSYPDLRLINSSKRKGSSIWQNDNRNHNGKYKKGKYKDQGRYDNNKYNNKRYKNDDIEDSIRRESRYPAIKQRAINKVRGMGYRVEDIELDERNNRGMFEIEAKRGGQEYEIILGYPNLNVIKVEKD